MTTASSFSNRAVLVAFGSLLFVMFGLWVALYGERPADPIQVADRTPPKASNSTVPVGPESNTPPKLGWEEALVLDTADHSLEWVGELWCSVPIELEDGVFKAEIWKDEQERWRTGPYTVELAEGQLWMLSKASYGSSKIRFRSPKSGWFELRTPLRSREPCSGFLRLGDSHRIVGATVRADGSPAPFELLGGDCGKETPSGEDGRFLIEVQVDAVLDGECVVRGVSVRGSARSYGEDVVVDPRKEVLQEQQIVIPEPPVPRLEWIWFETDEPCLLIEQLADLWGQKLSVSAPGSDQAAYYSRRISEIPETCQDALLQMDEIRESEDYKELFPQD